MTRVYKSFFSTLVNNSIIRNINAPACIDCIYFDKYVSKDMWSIDEKLTRLSKCTKFGVKNVVSGEIHYDYAHNCRSSNQMCKESGVFFSKKT